MSKNQLLSFKNPADRFSSLDISNLTETEKQSLVTLAMNVLAIEHQAGESITSPESTRNYLQLKLADYKNEVFGCIYLDNRHRVLAMREMFQGTIDGASVHPRVIVQQALEVNAAATIFFHNHPSGVADPSQADIALTGRLKEALALIDVRVLDHYIVCPGESVSFSERGFL